jgi:hypothetical protein
MFLGRSEETEALSCCYESGKSSLIVVYGRTGIGKTSFIKNFAKSKPYFYYQAPQASARQQISMLTESIIRQIGFYSADELEGLDVTDTDVLLKLTERLGGDTKLVVIDEFQNIIKQNKNFIKSIVKLVDGELFDGNVCVVLLSSSISWIENSLISEIGTAALKITKFIKLKELSFVETVRMFPSYSVPDSMMVYAITGGVPAYMNRFSEKLTVRENVCRNILDTDAYLRDEGAEFIRMELREAAVYNTIIKHIADGTKKLNDLHSVTGFGRDKISVYLKNLSEREIVEKVYSYESDGHEFTKKGLYRIKSAFTEFWFRYVYGNESLIELMTPEEYYDEYIAPTLDEFALESFIKVGTEFISLMDSMGKLPLKIERTGRWWGKNGDIDIIGVSHDQRYIIGKCSWLDETFRYETFLELVENVRLAHIGSDYIYLFSRNSFDDELRAYAREHENIRLISLNEL